MLWFLILQSSHREMQFLGNQFHLFPLHLKHQPLYPLYKLIDLQKDLQQVFLHQEFQQRNRLLTDLHLPHLTLVKYLSHSGGWSLLIHQKK